MSKKNKINFVLLAFINLAVCSGCSTKKNTPATRAYHELTTRYNVYFNAEEAYNNALQNVFENHKDNYHSLLSIFPNSAQPQNSTQKQAGGAFDAVIEKTAKAIGEHSISAKPRRDAAQIGSQEYRDWLRQNEFNPFIHRAWLLMGKAHVQNGDYTDAVSVFSQTARLFNHDIDVVSEAQIWMMRAYTEMGWFSDAETLANTLLARTLSDNLRKLFGEFYAFLLLQQEKFGDAVPYLISAIDNERNATQKRRLQFLLGQIYSRLGNNEKAFQAFEKVKGLQTPHEVSFNAWMAQSHVLDRKDWSKTIDRLAKMAKRPKNGDYLDRIYFAIGNIYALQNDTEKAIQSYLAAEKKSTRNGIDKALAQIALGDIYFDRKEFVKAEPRYAEALGALPETDTEYAKVKFRAEVLSELSPHLAKVEEQDSLQHLAKLPKTERSKIIGEHIAQLKKQNRESEENAYLAQQQGLNPDLAAQQPLSAAESAAQLANRGTETVFYFYNAQLVAQGKTEFRRQWGNRTLQDNWRLQNATSIPSRPVAQLPSRPVSESSGTPTDPFSIEFYVRQLPLTPELVEKSNKIIESNLFSAGNIVKDRLLDFGYAIGIFNRLLADFPQSEHLQDVYHQLYLIYRQHKNDVLARDFKNKIISEFPKSRYATAMSEPDYEQVMQNFSRMQDSLYQHTFRSYRQGDFKTVRNNFNRAEKLFSGGDLMPKFMLLNALSYAQTAESEKLKTALEKLTTSFPQGIENALAQDILSQLSEGKTPVVNASAVSDADWQQGFAPQNVADTVSFSADKNSLHSFLLAFRSGEVKKNELLFAVSDFNFSTFQLRTFNTSFIRIEPLEALQIKPFRSFDEANRYARMIGSDSVFGRAVSGEIIPIIISDSNLTLLNNGKSAERYLDFYRQKLAENLPVIESSKPVLQDSAEIVLPTHLPETEKNVPLDSVKTDKPHIAPNPPKTIDERRAELEQKAEEALRQSPKSVSEKERKQTLKERERARKEQIKQRDAERQKKLKEQEQKRKERLKERERALRQKKK